VVRYLSVGCELVPSQRAPQYATGTGAAGSRAIPKGDERGHAVDLARLLAFMSATRAVRGRTLRDRRAGTRATSSWTQLQGQAAKRRVVDVLRRARTLGCTP